jgi:4-amino-4-deoxy-L-arabinose transferase-like glycosyltransferase
MQKKHLFNKKRFTVVLWSITLVALLLRLGVSFDLAAVNNGVNSVMTPSSQTDMATYMTLSENIAKGEYRGLFYYQPFYYAVFLPVIKLIFGSSIQAVFVMQSILGAATVLLGGLCAAQLGGRLAGVITAALIAFSSAMVLYTPFHLIAVLQSFWMVLLFYCILIAVRRRRWFLWGIVGLVTGCSILTRGNGWFFVPGILALLSYFQLRADAKLTRARKTGNCMLVAGAFMFFLILPQLPFVYHNSSLNNTLTGPSTAAGSVLALGNTPEAPPGGRNPGSYAGPMEYPTSYQVWMSGIEQKTIARRIIDWFAKEPGAFLELSFRKLLLFWDYREIPNNISFTGEGSQSWILNYLAIIPSGLIIALGLAGILSQIPVFWKKKRMLLLTYLIVAYWGATAAFYILCRFRAPVLPFLAIAAGYFVQYALMRWRTDTGKAYLVCGLLLCVGVYITSTAYEDYRRNFEAKVMRMVRPNGVSLPFADGKFMQLDHGPVTFGGWTPGEFVPGLTLQKNFADVSDRRSTDTVQFEITLGFNQPGRVLLEISGEQKIFSSSKQGLVSASFEIPYPANGQVSIRMLSAEGVVYYFLDSQRDYGRTIINGKTVPGELVCRIYFIPKQKPKPSDNHKAPDKKTIVPGIVS